jgi:hypothetical protein
MEDYHKTQRHANVLERDGHFFNTIKTIVQTYKDVELSKYNLESKRSTLESKEGEEFTGSSSSESSS